MFLIRMKQTKSNGMTTRSWRVECGVHVNENGAKWTSFGIECGRWFYHRWCLYFSAARK